MDYLSMTSNPRPTPSTTTSKPTGHLPWPYRAPGAPVLLALTCSIPLACGTPPPSGGSTNTGTDTSPDTDTGPGTGPGTDTGPGTGPGTDTGADTDPTGTTGIDPDQWDELVEVVPGSRLRPIMRVGEDDTRAHIGWHDSLFDAPCEFRDNDGVLSCIPITRISEPWLYADPSCTEPVLQQGHIPDDVIAVTHRGHDCFGHSVYELGEEVGEIYYDANGPCEWFSNDPSRRLYLLSAEDLVSATVTPAEGNSRIVPLVLQADDGARQIVGAWDTVHEEEVVPDVDGAGQLRWFGRWNSRVSPHYYADPGCTERVAASSCVSPGQRPQTAIEMDPSPCGPVVGRHQLLDEVEQLYSSNGGGGCVEADLPSDTRWWRVGGALGDDAFAATPFVDDGGMRLRHDVYANPEGEPFLSSTLLRDPLLMGVVCDWRDALPPGSGVLECIPEGAPTITRRYADATCTQQTAERPVPLGGGCMDDPMYAHTPGFVAQILGPTGGPGGYIVDELDDCVPTDPPDGGDSGDGGEGEEYFLIDEPYEFEVAHAADVVE